MFRGRFSHTMDAKGRVSIPSGFRMELKGNSDKVPVITNGLTYNTEDPDQVVPCLWLFSHEGWSAYQAHITSIAPNNPKVQAFVRFMVSGATDCPIDNQGRSLLPQYLREHGEFDREVTFAGVGDHVEIWSAPLLEADLSRTRAQFPQIAEVLSNLDN